MRLGGGLDGGEVLPQVGAALLVFGLGPSSKRQLGQLGGDLLLNLQDIALSLDGGGDEVLVDEVGLGSGGGHRLLAAIGGRAHRLADLHDEVGLGVGRLLVSYHSHVGGKVYALRPEGLELAVELVALLLNVLLLLLECGLK